MTDVATNRCAERSQAGTLATLPIGDLCRVCHDPLVLHTRGYCIACRLEAGEMRP